MAIPLTQTMPVGREPHNKMLLWFLFTAIGGRAYQPCLYLPLPCPIVCTLHCQMCGEIISLVRFVLVGHTAMGLECKVFYICFFPPSELMQPRDLEPHGPPCEAINRKL